jgi:hypothetical protein
MVRSGQPTGVLIPVVYLFGGQESKAKNSKVPHEYAEHREHWESILVRPPESNTLRPFVGVDCLRIGRGEYKGRLVRLILASGWGRFPDSWSVTTRRPKSMLHILPYLVDLLLGEIHQGLVLYAKSWGHDGLGEESLSQSSHYRFCTKSMDNTWIPLGSCWLWTLREKLSCHQRTPGIVCRRSSIAGSSTSY